MISQVENSDVIYVLQGGEALANPSAELHMSQDKTGDQTCRTRRDACCQRALFRNTLATVPGRSWSKARTRSWLPKRHGRHRAHFQNYERQVQVISFWKETKPRITVRSWISNLASARAAFTKLLLLHKEQWWNARQKSFSSAFWNEDQASRCRASSVLTWQALGIGNEICDKHSKTRQPGRNFAETKPHLDCNSCTK